MSADEALLARLRSLANREGLDPERVIADFRHGGALAQLVRKLLGGSAARRGPQANNEVNWFRFVLVVHAKRSGSSNGKYGADVFGRAADILRHDRDNFDPDDKMSAKLKRTYSRMRSEKGWKDEDVPDGLAGFFSSPPTSTE